MTMGERIRQRREELGLSQDEVAIRCGYKSRSSINKIETKRSLPIDKVEVIARVLEVSPAYIMGWYDDDPPEVEKADPISPKALRIARKYDKADSLTQEMVDRILKED